MEVLDVISDQNGCASSGARYSVVSVDLVVGHAETLMRFEKGLLNEHDVDGVFGEEFYKLSLLFYNAIGIPCDDSNVAWRVFIHGRGDCWSIASRR